MWKSMSSKKRTYMRRARVWHIQTNQRIFGYTDVFVCARVCACMFFSFCFFLFFFLLFLLYEWKQNTYANESDTWYVTRFNLEVNAIVFRSICTYLIACLLPLLLLLLFLFLLLPPLNNFTTLYDAFHLILYNFIFGKSPATLSLCSYHQHSLTGTFHETSASKSHIEFGNAGLFLRSTLFHLNFKW